MPPVEFWISVIGRWNRNARYAAFRCATDALVMIPLMKNQRSRGCEVKLPSWSGRWSITVGCQNGHVSAAGSQAGAVSGTEIISTSAR